MKNPVAWLYHYSLRPDIWSRSLYRAYLVFINAIFGFFLSGAIRTDYYAMILGICSWWFLYFFILAPRYQALTSNRLKQSIFTAYMLKTLVVIFLVGVMLDVVVGSESISIVSNLFIKLGIGEHITDSFALETDFLGIYTYLTVMLHGFILTGLTLFFGLIMYWISILFSPRKIENKKEKRIE